MNAWFTFILSGAMIVECALNMGITGLSTLSYSAYIKNDEKMANTLSRISADENNGFFRLDVYKRQLSCCTHTFYHCQL